MQKFSSRNSHYHPRLVGLFKNLRFLIPFWIVIALFVIFSKSCSAQEFKLDSVALSKNEIKPNGAYLCIGPDYIRYSTDGGFGQYGDYYGQLNSYTLKSITADFGFRTSFLNAGIGVAPTIQTYEKYKYQKNYDFNTGIISPQVLYDSTYYYPNKFFVGITPTLRAGYLKSNKKFNAYALLRGFFSIKSSSRYNHICYGIGAQFAILRHWRIFGEYYRNFNNNDNRTTIDASTQSIFVEKTQHNGLSVGLNYYFSPSRASLARKKNYVTLGRDKENSTAPAQYNTAPATTGSNSININGYIEGSLGYSTGKLEYNFTIYQAGSQISNFIEYCAIELPAITVQGGYAGKYVQTGLGVTLSRLFYSVPNQNFLNSSNTARANLISASLNLRFGSLQTDKSLNFYGLASLSVPLNSIAENEHLSFLILGGAGFQFPIGNKKYLSVEYKTQLPSLNFYDKYHSLSIGVQRRF